MRFRDDDEIKATTELWFEDQIDDLFQRHRLLKRKKWAKGIEVKGDYIEK